MRQIILASASPRRKELLQMMGLDFIVMPSDFNEWLDDAQSPEDVSKALAEGKARAVAEKYPEAIVIGSDTIVTVEGKQLAKAATDEAAREMLGSLAGRAHEVTTGVAVLCLAEDFRYIDADTAHVVFKPYNTAEVEKYIATGDYRDKAGAYGIQSGALPLIDHYEGDIETIIGLPTQLLLKPLEKFGYNKLAVANYSLNVPFI